ncbi:glycosyltransferase [Burkholderia pseudomallei]|uniref:glycosyltransferase n=1 Tax=Burkholderia pseudomallei TaxID=28450 RepID=UPI001F5CC780|nr:glycosyltransferase [Burkholderia pseudomallei]
MAADDLPRPAREPAQADPGREAELPRVPRPHLAGKARRHRDPHRRAGRHADQDRREARQGRSRVLRRKDQAALLAAARRVHRRDQRSREGRFLGNAHALLFPIDWPEPFGLVMIEAMACGTPVIAFKRGSVPEVIENGVSGFVVEDELSAVAAVKRLNTLPRERVRAAFDARFTSKVMAQNYVKGYEELLRRKRRTVLREVNAG